MRLRFAHLHAAGQHGLSLIEMMVGIAIGMIVVAGASVMMTNQISEHGKLMQETQIQQDLRATADLMLRDLRRAGFWAKPESGVWAPDAPAAPNVYASGPASSDDGTQQVQYSYSRSPEYVTGGLPAENNAVESSEAFGFRLSDDGVLRSLLGGNWQALTDPDTLTITDFSIRTTVQPIALGAYCSPPCPVASGNCPEMRIRRFDITLTGQSKRDPTSIRTISVSSRVRNDEIAGACPAPPP